MASVTLARMWINLASDLTQAVQLRHTNWSGQDSIPGEVREYAGGRVRPVLHEAALASQKFSALTDDMTVVDQLKAWLGQTVLVRDLRGRSAWVVFLAVDQEDVGATWTRLSLTPQRVTYDPSV